MKADVVVIGAGLAGAAAALAARAGGATVVVCDAGPRGAALWSGLGDVFGRDSAPGPPATNLDLPVHGGAPTARAAAAPSAEERLLATTARAPQHPYATLGLTADSLAALVSDAATLLGLSGTFAPGSLTATNAGTLRTADFFAEGVLRVEAGANGTCVGLSVAPQWSPEWAARSLSEATGGRWAASWSDVLGATPRTSAMTAVVRADDADRVVAELAQAAPNGGVVATLPVLGDTFERRRELDALAAARGIELREVAGAFDSGFGLRLSALLAARVGERRGGVAMAPVYDGGVWRIVTSEGAVTCRELVVAVGDAGGRGGRVGWFDEWAGPSARPDRHTADSPWLRQPFLDAGLAVDGDLRAVGVPGAPLVCGGAIRGHDVAHDATAFGVALATGLLCGRALEAGR
ncbi:MAG: FAD-binding protein [Myxococcales bacterium]|nr:FAD-binding protein [Myxococcales bacterium]